MFREWRILKSEVKDLESKIKKLENQPPPIALVSCEKCGCAVLKENAIKGKGIIKTKEGYSYWRIWKEDYIHYPYYCKLHTPKEK